MANEYWMIFAEDVCDQLGIDLSREQQQLLADLGESASQMEGELCGHVDASKSLWAEQIRTISNLKSRLEREESKIPCPVCAGKLAPSFGGETEPARYSCENCNRTGKVDP